MNYGGLYLLLCLSLGFAGTWVYTTPEPSGLQAVTARCGQDTEAGYPACKTAGMTMLYVL